MELRQLEGEAHVPVGGALALLDGGDEDVPPRGHVASPLVSLGKKAGRLELDLIDPLKRLADAPGSVEVLQGDVLVSGLGVDDVPDLEVGPRADQIGRGEVEDGTEAANGLLDHVGLEAGVGHAQEGRVPRLVRAGHGGQAGRRREARGTAAHSTFRIFNLQYNTTLLLILGDKLIYRVHMPNLNISTYIFFHK